MRIHGTSPFDLPPGAGPASAPRPEHAQQVRTTAPEPRSPQPEARDPAEPSPGSLARFLEALIEWLYGTAGPGVEQPPVAEAHVDVVA